MAYRGLFATREEGIAEDRRRELAGREAAFGATPSVAAITPPGAMASDAQTDRKIRGLARSWSRGDAEFAAAERARRENQALALEDRAMAREDRDQARQDSLDYRRGLLEQGDQRLADTRDWRAQQGNVAQAKLDQSRDASVMKSMDADRKAASSDSRSELSAQAGVMKSLIGKGYDPRKAGDFVANGGDPGAPALKAPPRPSLAYYKSLAQMGKWPKKPVLDDKGKQVTDINGKPIEVHDYDSALAEFEQADNDWKSKYGAGAASTGSGSGSTASGSASAAPAPAATTSAGGPPVANAGSAPKGGLPAVLDKVHQGLGARGYFSSPAVAPDGSVSTDYLNGALERTGLTMRRAAYDPGAMRNRVLDRSGEWRDKVDDSRRNAVQGLLDQGIVDPALIENYLNYHEDGTKVGDFTQDEIIQRIAENYDASHNADGTYKKRPLTASAKNAPSTNVNDGLTGEEMLARLNALTPEDAGMRSGPVAVRRPQVVFADGYQPGRPTQAALPVSATGIPAGMSQPRRALATVPPVEAPQPIPRVPPLVAALPREQFTPDYPSIHGARSTVPVETDDMLLRRLGIDPQEMVNRYGGDPQAAMEALSRLRREFPLS